MGRLLEPVEALVRELYLETSPDAYHVQASGRRARCTAPQHLGAPQAVEAVVDRSQFDRFRA